MGKNVCEHIPRGLFSRNFFLNPPGRLAVPGIVGDQLKALLKPLEHHKHVLPRVLRGGVPRFCQKRRLKIEREKIGKNSNGLSGPVSTYGPVIKEPIRGRKAATKLPKTATKLPKTATKLPKAAQVRSVYTHTNTHACTERNVFLSNGQEYDGNEKVFMFFKLAGIPVGSKMHFLL